MPQSQTAVYVKKKRKSVLDRVAATRISSSCTPSALRTGTRDRFLAHITPPATHTCIRERRRSTAAQEPEILREKSWGVEKFKLCLPRQGRWSFSWRVHSRCVCVCVCVCVYVTCFLPRERMHRASDIAEWKLRKKDALNVWKMESLIADLCFCVPDLCFFVPDFCVWLQARQVRGIRRQTRDSRRWWCFHLSSKTNPLRFLKAVVIVPMTMRFMCVCACVCACLREARVCLFISVWTWNVEAVCVFAHHYGFILSHCAATTALKYAYLSLCLCK